VMSPMFSPEASVREKHNTDYAVVIVPGVENSVALGRNGIAGGYTKKNSPKTGPFSCGANSPFASSDHFVPMNSSASV
jgi:hypothetical protein